MEMGYSFHFFGEHSTPSPPSALWNLVEVLETAKLATRVSKPTVFIVNGWTVCTVHSVGHKASVLRSTLTESCALPTFALLFIGIVIQVLVGGMGDFTLFTFFLNPFYFRLFFI